LKRLRDEGYEVEVRGGYLIIHHIPYVDSNKEIGYGKLISTLNLNDDKTIKPETHVINFMGAYPCNFDGTKITAIEHCSLNQKLFEDIDLNYSFSNKPPNGYDNYYDKVFRYIEIISSQAKEINPILTAKTFRVINDSAEDTVFNYIDTNTSRANIDLINNRFKGQKIGIIGLGGTGSYILDMVSKTPVNEIHIFDGDAFLQHNAFRAPGAPSKESLGQNIPKVDYFGSIYSRMHRGIISNPVYVTEENCQLLNELSYVFICIDSNHYRGVIVRHLLGLGIPFLDVGLGVNVGEDNLVGTLRVTVGTSNKNNHLFNRMATEDTEENEYATNIQIADLNALNAMMAVIKWKKMCGFYQDLKEEHHSTYTINTSQLINEEFPA
jgi:hypothetical protein